LRTDPRELHGQTIDLLVIGGGIHGAAIARDAACRGLSTALVEARDFGGGTSSRSSRLIHGGLRYLAQGHLSLVREALRERERLLRQAPHLVRPLPMLMPFFRGGRSPLITRLGIRAYAFLAGRSTLPGPRPLSASEAEVAFPGLRRDGLRSAVLFFDAATSDQRITLANVEGAAAAGAVVANWCAATGVAGGAVQLHCAISGADVAVRARAVVNAAGPHADALRRTLGIAGADLVRTSRGSHLVLAPRAGENAIAAFLPDGRIQFVVPHPGGTLCGTTDVDDAAAVAPTVPAADVQYLLAALGQLLAVPPTIADVTFAYCGHRSLPAAKGPAGGLNREAFVVREPFAGGELHTVVGGKLTTHRSLAERAVAQITGGERRSPTADLPLPGGDGPRDVQDPLWQRHGSVGLSLRALHRGDAALLSPLCPHRPFLAVEAVHALTAQAAVTFADLMLRRLVHVQGPCLRDECLRAAHALFLQHRRLPVDDDVAAASAALRDEVRQLSGGLAASLRTGQEVA
jgi:glycerol-3-phosphate dehydrogenase